MAALTDAPSVYVDGSEQSPGWSLTERAVLDGVKITWGRESHLDKANPATAYVELLDTDGHLQGYKSLVGKTLTIYRAPSDEHDWALRLFNGRVDKFDVEIRWITDPELFYKRRIWVLKVAASDRLADLARAVVPGTGDDDVGPGSSGLVIGPRSRRCSASGIYGTPGRAKCLMPSIGATLNSIRTVGGGTRASSSTTRAARCST